MDGEIYVGLKDYFIETEDWGTITQTEIVTVFKSLEEAQNGVKLSMMDDEEDEEVVVGYVAKFKVGEPAVYYNLDSDKPI